MKSLRRAFGAVTLERLLPLACLAGALILIGSEFSDTFRLQAPGDETLDRFQGTERHAWSILVLGLFAGASVVIAVLNASKPAATAVAAFGVVALALFLLIDVPDAGRVETYDYEGHPFVQAEAQPEGGFWLLLVGSLVLAICGTAMATLSTEQLRRLRPDSGGGSRQGRAERRPAPPWGRRDEPPSRDDGREERKRRRAAKRDETDKGGQDPAEEAEEEPQDEPAPVEPVAEKPKPKPRGRSRRSKVRPKT